MVTTGHKFFWIFLRLIFHSCERDTSSILHRNCVFSSLTILCTAAFYYKNISWAILRLTLKQGNVRVVLISAAMIFGIDIFVHENHQAVLSAIFGFVYMAAVMGNVFLDSIKEKVEVSF